MIAQHLLVPVDFTEHSESALNHAQELAVLCKARLTLVHVIETPTFTVGPWGVPVESYLKEMDAQLRQMLDKYVKSAERAGVMCEAVIRTGRAYQEIVDEAKAKGVDLIVMASRSRSGLESILLGSVTERVLRMAPCHILVTRSSASSAQG